MFDPINNRLKRARMKHNRPILEPEPLQPITSANPSGLTGQHGDYGIAIDLPKTADLVKQIQASLAQDTRNEFANVIEQLNASQGRNK